MSSNRSLPWRQNISTSTLSITKELRRSSTKTTALMVTVVLLLVMIYINLSMYAESMPNSTMLIKHPIQLRNTSSESKNHTTPYYFKMIADLKVKPTNQSSAAEKKHESVKQYKGEAQVCKNGIGKVKRFVMAKIEETRSEALFVILTRFVMENKLNTLMQKRHWHFGWRIPKGRGWEIGPDNVTRAHVLINHVRYDQRILGKFLLPGYKLIVPIREPVSWLHAAVENFGEIVNHASTEEVVANNELLYQERISPMGILTWFHLPQLQWLGFDYKLKDSIEHIKEYIQFIVPKIDVPVLYEEFDSSLVILRRRFCWDYTDIFYTTKNHTEKRMPDLSPAANQKILSEKVNLGEELLYEAINKVWWNQPELNDEDFWDEVAHFTELNRNATTWCNQLAKTGGSYTVPASQWHQAIEISSKLCIYLSIIEPYMVKKTGSYAFL